MRISKWHLLICAAVICGSTVAIRADDNPDQAAARAALEAKMRALNAQPANAQTSAPTAQKPINPPPAEKPAMTTAPAAAPAQRTQPASAASGSDHGLFAPVPPPSGSMPAVAPTQTMRPASTAPSSDHRLFAPVPPPSNSPALEESSTNGQTLSPFTGPFFSGSLQNTNALYPGRELGLKPITAPPLPISAAQQAQLQALLNKYDANLISPDQYQAQRAKILAERK